MTDKKMAESLGFKSVVESTKHFVDQIVASAPEGFRGKTSALANVLLKAISEEMEYSMRLEQEIVRLRGLMMEAGIEDKKVESVKRIITQ